MQKKRIFYLKNCLQHQSVMGDCFRETGRIRHGKTFSFEGTSTIFTTKGHTRKYLHEKEGKKTDFFLFDKKFYSMKKN